MSNREEDVFNAILDAHDMVINSYWHFVEASAELEKAQVAKPELNEALVELCDKSIVLGRLLLMASQGA